jgi:hypothetical protein
MVYSPHSKYRAGVTPAMRGKRKKSHSADEADQTPAEKRASMTWAKRLKRVFNIDIETCSECGGDVRIIASIEDPTVIQKILTHLDDNATSAATALQFFTTAPSSAFFYLERIVQAHLPGYQKSTIQAYSPLTL